MCYYYVVSTQKNQNHEKTIAKPYGIMENMLQENDLVNAQHYTYCQNERNGGERIWKKAFR